MTRPTLLLVLALTACAEPRPSGPAPDTIVRGKASRAVLKGSAGFRGTPPRAQPSELDEAMAKAAGAASLPDETWKVDRLARLADVVILALPRDAAFAKAKARPLQLSIAGPRFEPRVAVAAPGSALRITRRSGPASALRLIALSGPAASAKPLDLTLPDKGPAETTLEAPGVYRIADPERPYLRAFIVVSPSPYKAVTGPGGAFEIILPEGAYTLRAWHEAAGWAEDSLRQLGIEEDNRIEVEYAVDGLVQGRILDFEAAEKTEPKDKEPKPAQAPGQGEAPAAPKEKG